MGQKVCLVTGASRGLGKAIASQLQEQGHKVYRGARKPKREDEIRLDVTQPAVIATAVDSIIAAEGSIDVLINNAGMGLLGPLEMATEEEMTKQFDVNLFGVVRMIQAVLPHMRERRSGQIVNIGSAVGVIPITGSDLYVATKFALEGLTAALAMSVRQWNVQVSLIDLGWVNTDFVDEMLRTSRPLEGDPYAAQMEEVEKDYRAGVAEGQNPEDAAERICQVIARPDSRFRHTTSPEIEQLLAEVLVDPTGNSQVFGV